MRTTATDTPRYRHFMRMTALELERSRHVQEAESLRKRLADLEDRLDAIDAEVAEIMTTVAPEANTGAANRPATSDDARTLRY